MALHARLGTLDRQVGRTNYRPKRHRARGIQPLMAFVYIDPSVGSLILQLLAAAVLSVATFVESRRRAVCTLFSRLTRRPQ